MYVYTLVAISLTLALMLHIPNNIQHTVLPKSTHCIPVQPRMFNYVYMYVKCVHYYIIYTSLPLTSYV